MAEDEIRSNRIAKLAHLKDQSIDPYPATSCRSHEIIDFLASFDESLQSQTAICLAGRIMSIRNQGAMIFMDIFDGTSRTQTLLKRDALGDKDFKLFLDAVSVSDFVELTGTALITKRGVKTLGVSKWRILAKSLRQVPDEWFGLKDDDERYRKRYLDMILDSNVSASVKRRSIFWNAIRSFMLERGYLEVETPILETTTGGAEARPFKTHHNALDIDVYLRISHELWHKRLIIGGFPKVFEIGRVFRNEGMSHEHAQDYTHFEFYEAYQDASKGIPMVKELYRYVAEKTFGTDKFTIGEHEVDLGAEWKDYDFNQLMQEHYDLDPRETDIGAVRSQLDRHEIKYDARMDVGRGIDLLWKKIRKRIGGPAILTGIPTYLEPLAKRSALDPRIVDRFQILLAGSEVGKAFNELNDPIDQNNRFEHQEALRDAGDDEAQMANYDYVEAMEYGMPPTFGFGVSERLFSFLSGISIRESQIFPLMKPK